MAYYNQFMEYLRNKPEEWVYIYALPCGLKELVLCSHWRKERYFKARQYSAMATETQKEKQPAVTTQNQSPTNKDGHYMQFLEYLKKAEAKVPDGNKKWVSFGTHMGRVP